MAADGRGLEEVQINDNFAKLTETLYVAEQKAREAVEARAQLQRELKTKEKEKNEEQLRELAQKARLERASGAAAGGEGVTEETEEEEDDQDKRRRDEIREERRKERERERRREEREGRAAKRSKVTRDRERDVSEKVALGQAAVSKSSEAMFDQRLFNQEGGVSSGFGTEDQNNAFDTNLFADRSHNLYKPSSSSQKEGREGPVQFEKEGEKDERDPFGLDQFLSEVSRGGSSGARSFQPGE